MKKPFKTKIAIVVPNRARIIKREISFILKERVFMVIAPVFKLTERVFMIITPLFMLIK